MQWPGLVAQVVLGRYLGAWNEVLEVHIAEVAWVLPDLTWRKISMMILTRVWNTFRACANMRLVSFYEMATVLRKSGRSPAVWQRSKELAGKELGLVEREEPESS